MTSKNSRSERLTSLRTSGIGILSVGAREFSSVEYFITTVGGDEPVVVGVIMLTPDDSKELMRLIDEPAILHLSDGKQVNVRLDPFRYLYDSSAPPVEFVVRVESLLTPS